MKRLLLCALLLLFVGGFAARAEANATLLVYMCGADIQYDACYDMYEMGLAEAGDDVNVVLLAGGADKWEFDEIPGGTRSLVTIRDGDFESIDDWGWKSMGSEESLLEFLEYGLTNYPADKTVVVLWNHGAGAEAGMCFDYTTKDEDGLTLNEINDVLYDLHESMGGFHIDVFGCDACMMATYEMATMLSYYDIDYFIASEELEPGTGWNYTPVLQALDRDPGMDSGALCRLIVDSYMEGALAENPDGYLTMSAVALRGLDPLQETVETFAAALLGQLEGGNIQDVRRGRSQMYTFGAFCDASWDMVDMGAMLDAYARFDPDLAAQARKQLGDAVFYSRQTDNLSPCSGLSVLIPQDTRQEFEYYSDGIDLSFYMPNWIGFVKAYAGLLAGGSYSFTPSAPEQVSAPGFLSSIAGMFSDSVAYGWNSDTETYEATEPAEAEVAVGEGDYAFSATLSPEDLRYLDYVEGMLMMDIGDEEMVAYLDLGLMRNNLVDWNSGSVYSMFDGTWPIFGDQLVPMYDQLSNERGRRSLIPVKLNGEYTYLVVEFETGSNAGRIVGANAGYDDNGLPIRNTTRLKDGDVIIPVYNMLVDVGEADMLEREFDGDEIIWHDGMAVTYEDISDDEGEALVMNFCFVLNDVFGDYTLTDPVAFEV